MEYKLIIACTITSFESEVNKIIKSGWSLLGQPFTGHNGNYCQAVTRILIS
jgi:hypothetical protein